VAELGDEQLIALMAKADGELSSGEEARLLPDLANRPDLLRCLDEFRLTGRPLGRLFQAAMPSTSVDPLVELIANYPKESYQAAAPKPIGAIATATKGGGLISQVALVLQSFVMPLAAAAACALALAFAGNWLLPGNQATDVALGPDGRLMAEGSLGAGLTNDPSGGERALGGTGASAASLRILETIALNDGRLCREFDLLPAAGAGRSGIACRSGVHWEIQALISHPRPSAAAYRTASSRDALDAIVETMHPKTTIQDEDELALIRSGWRR
jgi:hypothetical protein